MIIVSIFVLFLFINFYSCVIGHTLFIHHLCYWMYNLFSVPFNLFINMNLISLSCRLVFKHSTSNLSPISLKITCFTTRSFFFLSFFCPSHIFNSRSKGGILWTSRLIYVSVIFFFIFIFVLLFIYIVFLMSLIVSVSTKTIL